jgi:hypothetical protein
MGLRCPEDRGQHNTGHGVRSQLRDDESPETPGAIGGTNLAAGAAVPLSCSTLQRSSQ